MIICGRKMDYYWVHGGILVDTGTLMAAGKRGGKHTFISPLLKVWGRQNIDTGKKIN